MYHDETMEIKCCPFCQATNCYWKGQGGWNDDTFAIFECESCGKKFTIVDETK